MNHRSIISRNLSWFQRSGVMRPADGFWGVAERLLVVRGNESMDNVNNVFIVQTPVATDVIALEHRRADCNFQAAYLFDLAAKALAQPKCKQVADNIIGYLLHRSGLYQLPADSPVLGMWGWSNPVHMTCRYWTDDNAWVVTLALALAARGRGELRQVGIAAARQMHRHVRLYLDHIKANGKDVAFPASPVAGLKLNPHWLGLATMAFAWAAGVDKETDHEGTSRDYYRIVLDGPPSFDPKSRGQSTGLPWTLSEYAYLTLCASIAAAVFDMDEARNAAQTAADILVKYQQRDGHFFAEHREAPAGTHLADMIYTQNWGSLGLYHAWLVFGRDERYRKVLDRSLRFLARIQDRSKDPVFRGCWRGMYDTQAKAWGGGDRYEGGQNSIYSGWTNAPIAWAFLFDMTGESLLPPRA